MNTEEKTKQGIRGRIIRGIGGFYYVYTEEEGIIECRARGKFRKDKMKPLPGDEVIISITHEKDREGSLDEICPRKNALIRPACANVDQALIIFAAASPEPHLNLLDRFLVQMHHDHVETVIAFNKIDLVSPQRREELLHIYAGSGCQVVPISVKHNENLVEIAGLLDGKTTVVAGPSGVGKSSLTNHLYPDAHMEVGEISRKIGRGKNTTRHTELVPVNAHTYLLDTPGFTSLNVMDISSQDLGAEFPEFLPYLKDCAFLDCRHIHEPQCGVKQALADGLICHERYESYLQILQELQDSERRW